MAVKGGTIAMAWAIHRRCPQSKYFSQIHSYKCVLLLIAFSYKFYFIMIFQFLGLCETRKKEFYIDTYCVCQWTHRNAAWTRYWILRWIGKGGKYYEFFCCWVSAIFNFENVLVDVIDFMWNSCLSHSFWKLCLNKFYYEYLKREP